MKRLYKGDSSESEKVMKILFTIVFIFVLAMLYQPLTRPVHAQENGQLFINLSNGPCLFGENSQLDPKYPLYWYVDSTCKSFRQTENAFQEVLDRLNTLNNANDLLLIEIHNLNIEIKELKERLETQEKYIDLIKKRVMEK